MAIGYTWDDLRKKGLWLILKFYPDVDARVAYEAAVFDQHGVEATAKGNSAELAISIAINAWTQKHEKAGDS